MTLIISLRPALAAAAEDWSHATAPASSIPTTLHHPHRPNPRTRGTHRQAHQPPLVRGRRIKLRYAHQGGRNPPRIVIHGNQTNSVPEAYRRYLVNVYRQAFDLMGTPVRVTFRGEENPYAGKRNPLTPRQVKKRKRLIQRNKR